MPSCENIPYFKKTPPISPIDPTESLLNINKKIQLETSQAYPATKKE